MLFFIFSYVEGSTKESSRQCRDKGASRIYTLRNAAHLPPQKVILTVTSNKAQLISLICEDLISHKEDIVQHKLVVTGSDPVPVEINNGVVIRRQDMTTTQEEGDTIVVQQVANLKAHTALVVADDTDIFVLLLHFCYHGEISGTVLMASPVHGRAVLDINASVEKHQAIIPDLLAAHALTGCDTVAPYFGIGKGTALKILRRSQYSLAYLGNVGIPMLQVTNQATLFVLACYGQSHCNSMTEAHQKMWTSKVGRSMACDPSLHLFLPQMKPSRRMWHELIYKLQSGRIPWHQLHLC